MKRTKSSHTRGEGVGDAKKEGGLPLSPANWYREGGVSFPLSQHLKTDGQTSPNHTLSRLCAESSDESPGILLLN